MAKTDREKRICLMRRKGSALWPVSQADEEIISELGEGDIEVAFKQRRSLPQMRLYWKMLSEVNAAVDAYPSAEHFHESLKMSMGYVTTVKTLQGAQFVIPDSIAFSRMGPGEFKGFFDRAVRLISETYGIDALALEKMAA